MDIKATAHVITQFLQDITPQHPTLNYQVVQDTQQHHYQLLVTGWQQNKRIHAIVVQIDLIDNLVWIQANGTDLDIVGELEERGISRDAIVLAYLSPREVNHIFSAGQ